MTKKLAIFVEGDTEKYFIRKLLIEIAGQNNIYFREEEQIRNKYFTVLDDVSDNKQYFVLLVNCKNDEKVKSAILERRKNLIAANFSLVLGLRDLYPRPLSDLSNVEMHLKTGVPTNDLEIDILLAVMEIEAWFLQEYRHYEKINPLLTIGRIASELDFDPVNDKADEIHCASALLHNIYSLVGLAYKKKASQVQRTVDNLDYASIYIELSDKIVHLKKLIDRIDGFFITVEPTAAETAA